MEYLEFRNDSLRVQLVACVDSLGTAKKLTIIDHDLLDLETDRGHWALSRHAYEPAFDCCGFVSVKLPLPDADRALYFDICIAAALAKERILSAFPSDGYEFYKGRDVPLYSEAESWAIIRNEMPVDDWCRSRVAQQITWVHPNGTIIPMNDDAELNEVLSFIGSGGSSPALGRLDTRLCLLCLLPKPRSDDRPDDNPYGYLAQRMSQFLACRYSHNENLAKYLSLTAAEQRKP